MKLDRKIDCNTLEFATPAEPKKAKKWRNKYLHVPTGDIDFGGLLHDTPEEALKSNHEWMKTNYQIIKRGKIPVDDDFNGRKVYCEDMQYLGPVEVDE